MLLPDAEGCRGPPWSWAAIDGKIEMPSWDMNPEINHTCIFAHVTEAGTTPVNDEFGQVRDGSLRICGTLSVMKLVSRRELPPNWDNDGLGDVQNMAVTHLDSQDLKVEYNEMLVTNPWKYDVFDQRTWSGAYDSAAQVFFMPIRSMDDDPVGITLCGKILIPTFERKGEFKRIGQFEVSLYNCATFGLLETSTKILNSSYYECVDSKANIIHFITAALQRTEGGFLDFTPKYK